MQFYLMIVMDHVAEEKIHDLQDVPEDTQMCQSQPSCTGSNRCTIRFPAATRWGTRHGMCEDLLFFRDPIEVCLRFVGFEILNMRFERISMISAGQFSIISSQILLHSLQLTVLKQLLTLKLDLGFGDKTKLPKAL